LSAEGMLDLLARGSSPQAMAGPTNVVTGIVDRMTDSTVAGFVSTNVISERGATDRLAQAFQTLVRDDEQRVRLLSLAREHVASSPLGCGRLRCASTAGTCWRCPGRCGRFSIREDSAPRASWCPATSMSTESRRWYEPARQSTASVSAPLSAW